jgi:DNA gyrase/topoisomerase IV subunit A
MAQNVMTNGVWRSKWTAKDYDDVKRAQTQLQQQLLLMNAAAMAKAIKAWLTANVPTFDRSWGSIMSHMGPPGVAIADAKDGMITRARAARNVAEAALNLEANRLHAVEEESRGELSAKDAQIEEIKKNLAKAQREREVLAQNVSANAEQSAAAAKAAADLRKELDEKNDALLQAQEREAIALAQAEAAKEAAEQERQLREQAEVQRRLAETKETFYLQQAETAKAQKRALARMLDESASSQQDASFDFSVQASKIQALIAQGKTDEANEATENLNRAVVPAAGPSASA